MWHQDAPSRLALTLTIGLIVLAISPYGESVKRDDLLYQDQASPPDASPSEYVPPPPSDAPPSEYVPPPPNDASPPQYVPPPPPNEASPPEYVPPPPNDASPPQYVPPSDNAVSPSQYAAPPSQYAAPPPSEEAASPSQYAVSLSQYLSRPPPPSLPSVLPVAPSLTTVPILPTPVSPTLSPPSPMPYPTPSKKSPTLSPPPISIVSPTLPSTTPVLSPPHLSSTSPTPSPPPSTLSTPLLSNVSPSPHASSPNGLQVGYYKGKCPDATLDIETLIEALVEAEFRNASSSILPHLLRMQFHDCFVHGCDASILINGNSTEKTADSNLSVKGYEFIDAVKTSIEAQCPDLVSCADIIAIATKYALKLAGGPDYPVQTGRKDGLVSKAQDVNLPSPTLTVNQTIAVFAEKNFTKEEMVVLLGCHTVGVAHCKFFKDRLYEGSAQFDPLMDPILREQLKSICPQNTNSSSFTGLNQNSNPDKSHVFDNSFYDQISKQRGILPIDQALFRDTLTSDIVVKLSLNATLFNVTLGDAMVKLQAVEVLTNKQGEVRKVCSKFNTKK